MKCTTNVLVAPSIKSLLGIVKNLFFFRIKESNEHEEYGILNENWKPIRAGSLLQHDIDYLKIRDRLKAKLQSM